MSTHNSPFQKRVLIPFWVLRLLFMLFTVGVYAFALWAIVQYDLDASDFDIDGSRLNSGSDDLKAARNAAVAILGVFVALLAICLLLDIVAMVLFCAHRLTPLTFLVFNVLQTAFWAGMLILSIIGASRASIPAGVLFPVLTFLLFLGLLIYASVIYHRERKGRHRIAYTQTPTTTDFDHQNQYATQYSANNPNTSYSAAPIPMMQYPANQGNAHEVPGGHGRNQFYS